MPGAEGGFVLPVNEEKKPLRAAKPEPSSAGTGSEQGWGPSMPTSTPARPGLLHPQRSHPAGAAAPSLTPCPLPGGDPALGTHSRILMGREPPGTPRALAGESWK